MTSGNPSNLNGDSSTEKLAKTKFFRFLGAWSSPKGALIAGAVTLVLAFIAPFLGLLTGVVNFYLHKSAKTTTKSTGAAKKAPISGMTVAGLVLTGFGLYFSIIRLFTGLNFIGVVIVILAVIAAYYIAMQTILSKSEKHAPEINNRNRGYEEDVY